MCVRKKKMNIKCSTCPEGGYDPCSDICDICKNDPDTGWGGFTDHSVEKHFNSEKERDEYYQKLKVK